MYRAEGDDIQSRLADRLRDCSIEASEAYLTHSQLKQRLRVGLKDKHSVVPAKAKAAALRHPSPFEPAVVFSEFEVRQILEPTYSHLGPGNTFCIRLYKSNICPYTKSPNPTHPAASSSDITGKSHSRKLHCLPYYLRTILASM